MVLISNGMHACAGMHTCLPACMHTCMHTCKHTCRHTRMSIVHQSPLPRLFAGMVRQGFVDQGGHLILCPAPEMCVQACRALLVKPFSGRISHSAHVQAHMQAQTFSPQLPTCSVRNKLLLRARIPSKGSTCTAPSKVCACMAGAREGTLIRAGIPFQG